jgi:AcrR family transcriptional regulator
MAAIRTARERARAELTAEIKAAARRQLAAVGASELSLRAVARELGMVSSALYRYYGSRDELLTALIIDAYDALGTAAETALAAPAASPRARWLAVADAIRAWGRANPSEYALIYGSPVPGYQAPRDTIDPALRVAFALLAPIRACAADGTLAPLPGPTPTMPDELRAQLDAIAAAVAPELTPDVTARALSAYTLVFGMISFELFGQYTNGVDPADAFFEYTLSRTADLLGLPDVDVHASS